jgi:hypothetical protein
MAEEENSKGPAYNSDDDDDDDDDELNTILASVNVG